MKATYKVSGQLKVRIVFDRGFRTWANETMQEHALDLLEKMGYDSELVSEIDFSESHDGNSIVWITLVLDRVGKV